MPGQAIVTDIFQFRAARDFLSDCWRATSDIGMATSDQVHELFSRLLPTTLGVGVSRRVLLQGWPLSSTCVVGELENGSRMVTLARWQDGAIAEEYVWL